MNGSNGNGKNHRRYHIIEYRCYSCGRLLFRSVMSEGTKIEIRCPGCGIMNVFPVPSYNKNDPKQVKKRVEVEEIDPNEYSANDFRKLVTRLGNLPDNLISDMIVMEQNGKNRSSVMKAIARLQK